MYIWSCLEQVLQHTSILSLFLCDVKQLDKHESNPNRQRETGGTEGTKNTKNCSANRKSSNWSAQSVLSAWLLFVFFPVVHLYRSVSWNVISKETITVRRTNKHAGRFLIIKLQHQQLVVNRNLQSYLNDADHKCWLSDPFVLETPCIL